MNEQNGSHIYKYNYLIASLRQNIFDQNFAPAGKIPTERVLSSMYSMSRVTVRAALQQLEQEGLIERRQGCGTRLKEGINNETPKLNKQKFRVLYISEQRATKTDVDPYFAQVFLGFHRASSSETTFDVDMRFLTMPIRIEEVLSELPEFDGYLIGYPASDEDIAYLERRRLCYLCMGHPQGYRTVPKIDIDNFYGTFIGVDHLLERNCRRIILLHHNYVDPLQQMVVSGYTQAHRQRGLEIDNDLIYTIDPSDRTFSEDCLEHIIARGIKFDAMLVMGDWATFGALNVLSRHHIRIPQEVKVVSYDAYPWLINGLKPQPTNIILPFAKMAEKALLMLANMKWEIDGIVMQSLVRPELNQGQST